MQKHIKILIALGLVLAFLGGLAVGGKTSQSFPVGAFDVATRFPNGHLDTNGGYYVDGGTVINGSGQITGNLASTTNTVQIGTFTQGGGIFATTTNTMASSTTAWFDLERQIAVTPSTNTSVISLPASSTFTSIITTAGEQRSVTIYNASTTGVATIQVVAGTGTGITLNSASSTAVLAEGKAATLSFERLSNTNLLVRFIPDF